MESQPNPEKETTQTPPQKINFKYQKTQLLTIDIQNTEKLADVLPILENHPFLLLHPNFNLTESEKKVELYQEIRNVIPTTDVANIIIKFTGFDKFSAKRHVLNCVQFFLKPNLFLYEKFLEFNVLVGKVEYLNKAIFKQQLKSNKREISQLLEGDMDEFNKIDFLTSEDQASGSDCQFFKKLKYCDYNPPIGNALLQGDLLYLELESLECKKYFITLNKNGCYQNSSTEEQFNSNQQSNSFFSLFDLFSSLCTIFKQQIVQYFDPKNPNVALKYSENFDIVNSKEIGQQFFYKNEPITKREKLLHGLLEILKPDTHGLDPNQYRDWNEEFQNLNSMPNDSVLAQIQRVKLLQKSQDNFKDAAQKMIQAINNNEIKPLNPSDNKSISCYVYNNIFATYAIDTAKWEQPKEDYSPSTYSSVNNDIKNLQVLYNMNIENVNTINTCSIDYLGNRLVIQTVIQGILHFDQQTWSLYGSIDEGKTMKFNEKFHGMMESVCKNFGISLNRNFQDSEGKEYTFHGSPEVKGIKAGDGREYIMDLMRLSPRDINYKDIKDHECCTVRPELVRNYIFFVNLQKQYIEHQKKLKQQQQEQEQKKVKPEVVNKQVENKDKKQNEESFEEINEKQKVKDEEIDKNQILKEKPFPSSFNPSLFTEMQSIDQNVNQDKEDLQILANYLKNDVISAFVKKLNTNPLKGPVDQESLITAMHESGINVRYLGYIYNLSVITKNLFLQQLVQRTIFVRSIRKYFRKIAFKEEKETLLNIIIQNLNMILGNDLLRDKIDLKISQYGQKNQQNNKKSKKNKKNKKVKLQQTTTSNVNQNMLVTVEEFLEIIKDIAQQRYEFPSENIKTFTDFNFLKTNKSKLSFLREFAKSFGISFEIKNYNFETKNDKIEYPLQLENITNYYPIIKSVQFNLDCLKYNQNTYDQLIQRKKYEDALSVLHSSQNMILNTYGLYHQEFIQVCKNIALVKFLQKKHDESISVQLFAVKLCQKLYGLDHRNTALTILELSNYLFDKKDFDNAVQFHTLALYIFDLIATEYNPSSLLCLHELQIMTQGQKNLKLSTVFMEELLKRNAKMYGETSDRLIYFLEKLAQLKGLEKDFEVASLLQARHYLILNRSFKKIQDQLNQQQIQNIKAKLKESDGLKKYYIQQRNKLRENKVQI